MPELIEAAPVASAAQAAPVAQPAKGETPPVLGKDGKPFDPERAQATIEAQREELKVAKAAQVRLAELEKARSEADEAKKIEQGKIQEVADGYKTERDTAIGERDSLKAERDKAFELLQGDADKRVAVLPEGVRNRVPSAKDASPLERLAKVAELEDLAKALAPAKPSPTSPLRGAVAAGNHAEQKAKEIPRPKLF